MSDGPRSTEATDRQRDEVAERVAAFLVQAPDPDADRGIPFRRAQFDAGLAWVHHPVGLGGLGLPAFLQGVVDEALQRAGVVDHRRFNPIGNGNAAPVLLSHGTDEQRERFLRPTFTSEHVWCQLMSEPNAGSDVAGLATQARRDGDGWIVNGQKVWTGFAHVAEYGMLVARTDPTAVKHAGITCFIVDMHAPGVEVRPLRQLTGRAEFNEVFFDDLVIDDAMRVGEVGAGWTVVHSNLEGERLSFTGGAGGSPAVAPSLAEDWRGAAGADAVLRQRLVQAYTRLWVLDQTIARAAQLRSAGQPALHASALKILRTETEQQVKQARLGLAGLDGQLFPGGYADTQDDDFHQGGTVQEQFLRSRAQTIEGGTSEVNRNVVGEQALGLPRDIRVDLGIPWNQIPR